MTQEMSDIEQEPTTSTKKIKTKKEPKKGIIYLSSIPPYLNVTKIREIFSEFGTLGRIFLQLSEKDTPFKDKVKKKRKIAKKFTEGWVEFERKSVAKRVAQFLNNTQVSNRKKSKQYDYMWNIKYLSNFKWTHLNERLAYEKSARRQKLRTEIQLAKKKSNFFTSNVGKTKKKTTTINKEYQNIPEETDTKMDIEDSEKVEDREEFLQSLFT